MTRGSSSSDGMAHSLIVRRLGRGQKPCPPVTSSSSFRGEVEPFIPVTDQKPHDRLGGLTRLNDPSVPQVTLDWIRKPSGSLDLRPLDDLHGECLQVNQFFGCNIVDLLR